MASLVEQEEELDPRVKIELEKLNTATQDINKLESILEDANNNFRTTLTESTARLKALAKKLGGCIEKARPYYEARELARTSQLDCQRAAVQYQRANALHQAAKETIALAEERFVNCRHEHWQFDSAWQEMLNHATIKVMEAEAQKAASEREHMKRAAAFTQAEQRVQQLERGLKSAIKKSLVYFEEKANVQAQLEGQKDRVQQLQQLIAASKMSYAQSLRSLEQISEEIHEQRRCILPREPGVGAELSPPKVADTSDPCAKPFSPLEESTAQEEKYWDTLRKKLEKLKVDNQSHLSSSSDDVLSDSELPETRERTVTGSSCNTENEVNQSEPEERVVPGGSKTGESGPFQNPNEGKEVPSEVLSVASIQLTCMSQETSEGNSGCSSMEYSKDEFSKDLNLLDSRPSVAREAPVGGDDSSEKASDHLQVQCDSDSQSDTVTPEDFVSSEEKDDNVNESQLNVGSNCDTKKDVVRPTNEDGAAIEYTKSDHEQDKGHREEEEEEKEEEEEVLIINVDDDDSDSDGELCKEKGDGSSSPPPAMCQPSRGLSVIPEVMERSSEFDE